MNNQATELGGKPAGVVREQPRAILNGEAQPRARPIDKLRRAISLLGDNRARANRPQINSFADQEQRSVLRRYKLKFAAHEIRDHGVEAKKYDQLATDTDRNGCMPSDLFCNMVN